VSEYEHPLDVGQVLTNGETVIGWGYYTEEPEVLGVLSLLPDTHRVFGNYRVRLWNQADNVSTEDQFFKNIVPAAEAYNDLVGVW